MSAEGQPEQTSGRGRRLHLQALRRSFVAVSRTRSQLIHTHTLARRCCDWCFAWDTETYPGIVRGFLSVLGNRVTWRSVQHWQAETRPIPPWARAVLADYLEGRARVALDLAAELRALPVRPDKRKAGNKTAGND